MRRSPMPRRSQPIARGTRLKARNPKRRQSEFARCYHSRERVLWVKARPCCRCGKVPTDRAPSDNAHTAIDGASRKAHYTTIVPLCRACHTAYDEYHAPYDRPGIRAVVAMQALLVEEAWAARWDATQEEA